MQSPLDALPETRIVIVRQLGDNEVHRALRRVGDHRVDHIVGRPGEAALIRLIGVHERAVHPGPPPAWQPPGQLAMLHEHRHHGQAV